MGGGGTKAFMRLAQSKLLRVISHAEDISSQRDRQKRKITAWSVGFKISSGSKEHNNLDYGQKVSHVLQQNEEGKQVTDKTSRVPIHLSGW